MNSSRATRSTCCTPSSGFRIHCQTSPVATNDIAEVAAIAISTTVRAWPAFRQSGLGLFTGDDWSPNQNRFGARSIVYGTLLVSAIALIVAVPLSVGIALFITELAPRRFRSSITTVMDVLASVPSVVFGLWGFLILRPHLKDIYNSIADAVSGIPVLRSIFDTSLSGQSFMTAGLIVGLMIVPIMALAGSLAAKRTARMIRTGSSR